MKTIDWDLVLTVAVAVAVTVGIMVLVMCAPSVDALVFGR